MAPLPQPYDDVALAGLSLSLFPALALGATVERTLDELPPQIGTDTELVVVSDKPGRLHWGVDGWRLPAVALRPAGSQVAGSGAVETRLTGPGPDGRYRVRVGPLAGVRSVQMVLRNDDGTWSTARGQDADLQVRAGVSTRRRPIALGRGPKLGRSAGPRPLRAAARLGVPRLSGARSR